MKRKTGILVLLIAAALLLTGCAMRTVEDMYALPKRSEEYSQLQSAIDAAMVGLEYAAPISGVNQQSVQTADLDGDGLDEYLVFASGNWEKPLQVLIFKQNTDSTCVLMDIIESNGAAFEQVEYVSFDDRSGLEIILGCQVSDQVLRNVSVYSFSEGRIQQLLMVGYSRFLTSDFDEDGKCELMVLRAGEGESTKGAAVLYTSDSGQIRRSAEEELSVASAQIRRIQTGKLSNGDPAVFVSGSDGDGKIVTDIFTMEKDGLFNLAASGTAETTMETLRNFFVYPEDIDEDDITELPAQLPVRPVSVWQNDADQSLLRWFALDPAGKETDKLFTFHDFLEGWYLVLDSSWAQRISIVEGQDAHAFFLWNEDFSEAYELFCIYSLTGTNRMEEAGRDGRFPLHIGETTVFAAKLEPDAGTYAITKEYLTESFRLIHQERRMN